MTENPAPRPRVGDFVEFTDVNGTRYIGQIERFDPLTRQVFGHWLNTTTAKRTWGGVFITDLKKAS